MIALRGFGRAMDRFTIYLPIMLMGLLALATYWLARNTPSAVPTSVQPELTHDPDYFLRNFSVKSFDPKGRMKTEIKGIEARHYPDTDTLEIDQPRMRSFGEDGSLTTGTATRALSNADGSEVQLFGDALITHDAADAQGKPLPKMEIRSEFLHFFANTEKMQTNKPVVLKRGEDVFQGDEMDYDNLSRVLDLRGRVHGVLQPRVQTNGKAP